MRVLRIDQHSPYQQIIGVGGIGTGVFFTLQGNQTLGRNESRAGELRDVRDYCKLHIALHYVAKLLGARVGGSPFHVVPIGMVGEDDAGRRLLQEMSAAGMDVTCVRQVDEKPTLFSICFQYAGGEGGNITTSNSAAAELSITDLDSVVPSLLVGGAKRTIALAVPEVPLPVRSHFLDLATRAGAFRAASFVPGEISAALEAGFFSRLDLLALNESEASELVGCHLSADDSRSFIDACFQFLHAECPKLQMIVSAGKNGAHAFAGGSHDYCPALDVKIVSTAGAGDALLGGVLAALACGIPLLVPGERASDKTIETALDLAVLLASYKCLSAHTIHPSASLEALRAFAPTLGLRFSAEIERLCVSINRQ
jgi:sugar/nucleoside kinase (ribokinase family)